MQLYYVWIDTLSMDSAVVGISLESMVSNMVSKMWNKSQGNKYDLDISVRRDYCDGAWNLVSH